MFDRNLLGSSLKDVFYTPDDDPNRSLDIYFPTEMHKKWPVVINVHGGAWSEGSKDWLWYSADFPQHNIVGVAINYRLSPAVKAPVHLHDVKTAIRFLRANTERFNLDPERYGIMGHSAGGHLASMAALTTELGVLDDNTHYPEYSAEVQAVAPCSGPSSLEGIPAHDLEFSKMIFGTADPDALIYREYSPMTYLRANLPPFLIVHGTADDVVDVKDSIVLHEGLQKFGNNSELLLIDQADHLFEIDGQTQDELIKSRIIPYFIKHLNGGQS
jgi:acetyl esterase/lipase